MSGKGDNPTVIWAGKGILATATGEGAVRLVYYKNRYMSLKKGIVYPLYSYNKI